MSQLSHYAANYNFTREAHATSAKPDRVLHARHHHVLCIRATSAQCVLPGPQFVVSERRRAVVVPPGASQCPHHSFPHHASLFSWSAGDNLMATLAHSSGCNIAPLVDTMGETSPMPCKLQAVRTPVGVGQHSEVAIVVDTMAFTTCTGLMQLRTQTLWINCKYKQQYIFFIVPIYKGP